MPSTIDDFSKITEQKLRDFSGGLVTPPTFDMYGLKPYRLSVTVRQYVADISEKAASINNKNMIAQWNHETNMTHKNYKVAVRFFSLLINLQNKSIPVHGVNVRGIRVLDIWVVAHFESQIASLMLGLLYGSPLCIIASTYCAVLSYNIFSFFLCAFLYTLTGTWNILWR